VPVKVTIGRIVAVATGVAVAASVGRLVSLGNGEGSTAAVTVSVSDGMGVSVGTGVSVTVGVKVGVSEGVRLGTSVSVWVGDGGTGETVTVAVGDSGMGDKVSVTVGVGVYGCVDSCVASGRVAVKIGALVVAVQGGLGGVVLIGGVGDLPGGCGRPLHPTRQITNKHETTIIFPTCFTAISSSPFAPKGLH
jgi:hypothetical protein